MLPVPIALAADPTIPFEKYELANGLDVVLAEDHSVPFVWVDVWYEVGSKDEEPGRSGFAHLFEHMLFQGSAHADMDYFIPLQKVGAQVNGNTTLDRTNYFEGVPAHQLPIALFMEADRMGWLVLDQKRLDNQKEVVRNERRQRYENAPYGEMWPMVLDAAFPEGHPYHIATIGRHEDLAAASLEDVKRFFEGWYVPNNATLVLCGDFKPAEAKALVSHYFDRIPGRPTPERRPPAPVTLAAEKVVKGTDDVPFDKVWLAWPTAPLMSDDDAAMDLVASALSDGKDSRLYRALVMDKRVAQDVSASESSLRGQSLFIVEAVAAEGHTGDELVAALDEVLAELRRAGITSSELELGRTSYEVQFWQSLTSIQGKATQLAVYNNVLGDPGGLAKDLDRYRRATVESVNDALRRLLPADRRVVLTVGPAAEATP
jgi:predicted Zn-dependent peptidase